MYRARRTKGVAIGRSRVRPLTRPFAPAVSILVVLVLATGLSGCGLFRKPPARTTEEPAPAQPGRDAQRRKPAAERSDPAVATRAPDRADSDSPLPAAAPSPLATINKETPPQVAAATRLADEGRALLSTGDDDAAMDALERAISVDPSNPYAYYFLAELHLRRSSYDQAIVFADRAALLSARLDGTWLTRSYAVQGEAYEATNRLGDARAAYRRALHADGRNQTARAGLERVEGKLGRASEPASN